jgi:hypothetical protein
VPVDVRAVRRHLDDVLAAAGALLREAPRC